jgi:hypothetical protein
MPEPSTTEGRRIQGELKNLLEDAAVRRAESSASRRQGYPPEHRAVTSRFMRLPSVHTGRTRDATPAALGRLGNKHRRHDRRARLNEKVRRGYHPRRRAWLEHLPPAQISNWDNLVKAFAGNFQGTYVRPGNSWDL